MPDRRRGQIVDGGRCFQVGRHRVCLDRRPEGWAVSVDGLFLGARYSSDAEAWQAGVRMVSALEAPAHAPVTPRGPERGDSRNPSTTPEAPGAIEG